MYSELLKIEGNIKDFFESEGIKDKDRLQELADLVIAICDDNVEFANALLYTEFEDTCREIFEYIITWGELEEPTQVEFELYKKYLEERSIGDYNALGRIGSNYYFGRFGYKKNFDKAYEMLSKYFDNLDHEADEEFCILMGNLHAKGLVNDGKTDYKVAEDYYVLATKKANGSAQALLKAVDACLKIDNPQDDLARMKDLIFNAEKLTANDFYCGNHSNGYCFVCLAMAKYTFYCMKNCLDYLAEPERDYYKILQFLLAAKIFGNTYEWRYEWIEKDSFIKETESLIEAVKEKCEISEDLKIFGRDVYASFKSVVCKNYYEKQEPVYISVVKEMDGGYCFRLHFTDEKNVNGASTSQSEFLVIVPKANYC
ncbi:MAG: hypothetical protein MJ189_04280 [Coriobacteriales bacterium]|nr:hypothetical protein [Coriobacteriales bacterium]